MKSALNVPEYVRDALAGVAQRLGFTSNQHSVDYDFRVFENNRSVVSVLYRVTFREEPREATVLCKVPPPDADETMLALFEREVFVYGKLLPALEQFQRTRLEEVVPNASSASSGEDDLSFTPSCHHAHCDAKRGEGIIILEDVQRRGFSNRHKFELLDYDHARLAMVRLGRFHATSLALKKHQPELFEQYRYMGDVTGQRVLAMEGFDQAMDQAFESASATLTAGDVARREKLARLRGCFAEELQNISDTALSEPFCVVCHGDYAGDNMMFSYNIKSVDEDNGRVMVQMSIGKDMEWLNEYFVQLITMQEYNKNSNVINSVKYEQYKDREKSGASTSKPESTRRNTSPPRSSGRKARYESESDSRSDDEVQRKDRKRHQEASRKDYTHRTSSGTKKKSHKYKQRREHWSDRPESSRSRRERSSPGEPGSNSSDDKVHKKKTKKKKRPRSRSRSRS